MSNEPGDLVRTLFHQLVDKAKSSQPVRTDGKSLTAGVVYSQMVLGMPVDPDEYSNPWSPMRGTTVAETVTGLNLGGAAGSSPPATVAGDASTAKYRKALDAAYRTSQLVDRMLMVTKDNSYLEYPSERKISFAYENIIHGMQAKAVAPLSPDVQKRVDAARRVLFEFDMDGEIEGKSSGYRRYVRNAEAYARAKKEYNDFQTATLNDPAKADSFPMQAGYYQRLVDEAWETFRAEGAEKIERALDTLMAVGVNVQERMIAKARKKFDAWNLGLAGVPDPVPYASITPRRWYDPEGDRADGWMVLEVTSAQYRTSSEDQSDSQSNISGNSQQSSTQAAGTLALGFINLGGGGGGSSASSSTENNSNSTHEGQFRNEAKNLSVRLEYALCTIERPYLLGDMFYMKNWYFKDNLRHSISNGTLDGQDDCLLPMIPRQFLAIRNVRIHSTQWGEDGKRLRQLYGRNGTPSTSSSGDVTAGAGVALGFINFGGAGRHAWGQSSSTSTSAQGDHSENEYGTTFDGETLTIRGTQIVAWLSEIVPACAPEDDPDLVTGTTAPTQQPATQPGA